MVRLRSGFIASAGRTSGIDIDAAVSVLIVVIGHAESHDTVRGKNAVAAVVAGNAICHAAVTRRYTRRTIVPRHAVGDCADAAGIDSNSRVHIRDTMTDAASGAINARAVPCHGDIFDHRPLRRAQPGRTAGNGKVSETRTVWLRAKHGVDPEIKTATASDISIYDRDVYEQVGPQRVNSDPIASHRGR